MGRGRAACRAGAAPGVPRAQVWTGRSGEVAAHGVCTRGSLCPHPAAKCESRVALSKSPDLPDSASCLWNRVPPPGPTCAGAGTPPPLIRLCCGLGAFSKPTLGLKLKRQPRQSSTSPEHKAAGPRGLCLEFGGGPMLPRVLLSMASPQEDRNSRTCPHTQGRAGPAQLLAALDQFWHRDSGEGGNQGAEQCAGGPSPEKKGN